MFTAESIYGTAPVIPGIGVVTDTAISATDRQRRGWRALVDPTNPIMWFGAVLLITVGAAGIAGSARIGPVKVAGAVGKGA
jgi:hypothetical protein